MANPIFYLALILVLPFMFFLSKVRRSCKSPPGPTKLPFIGNLHQMVGSLPHQKLQTLSQKHGPLMHLQLGELSAIVVSSPKLAKEVLQTNSLTFANRPNLTVAKVMAYNTLGITFSPYGDYWRQMRQIYVTELLNTKSVESLYSIMEDELSNLKAAVASRTGEPVVLGEVILPYLSSTISRATVGRVCRDQGALISATREASSLAGVFNLEDLFPSVKVLRFFTGMRPRLEKLNRKLDGILEDIYYGISVN